MPTTHIVVTRSAWLNHDDTILFKTPGTPSNSSITTNPFVSTLYCGANHSCASEPSHGWGPAAASPLRHKPQLCIRAVTWLQLSLVPGLCVGEAPGLPFVGKVDPEQRETILSALKGVHCKKQQQQQQQCVL
jgi:hypothetical protein